MTVHGRYTGVLRDDFGSVWDAHNQDYPGANTGAFRAQNMPRRAAGDVAGPGSGIMLSTALMLRQGDVVSNLTFVSGDTGGSGLTHWWFALYSNDPTPALLAQTADQAAAAWDANTAKTLPMASPVTIGEDGVYYTAVMVAATTAPSYAGSTGASGAVIEGDPVLSHSSGSDLTGTAPAAITGAAVVSAVPLVVAT